MGGRGPGLRSQQQGLCLPRHQHEASFGGHRSCASPGTPFPCFVAMSRAWPFWGTRGKERQAQKSCPAKPQSGHTVPCASHPWTYHVQPSSTRHLHLNTYTTASHSFQDEPGSCPWLSCGPFQGRVLQLNVKAQLLPPPPALVAPIGRHRGTHGLCQQ